MIYLMSKISSKSCRHGTTICKDTATASASQNGAVDKGNITHAKQVNKRHTCNTIHDPFPSQTHPPSLPPRFKLDDVEVQGSSASGWKSLKAASGLARGCPQVGLKKGLVQLPHRLPDGEHGQGAPKYSQSHHSPST